MKRYTKKQFLQDVKAEAEALRNHATPQELKRLNIQGFNPLSSYRCIYGQMTGDCHTDRAAELIFECCVRFVDTDKYNRAPGYMPADGFKAIAGCTTELDSEGVETLERFIQTRTLELQYFSAIEAYIMMPEAKNDNLIAYLKKETDTLEL